MDLPSLKYIVKKVSEWDSDGPFITEFNYEDEDDLYRNRLNNISKVSSKTKAVINNARSTLMRLIHGTNIDPEFPPGIGLNNVTIQAKLFASMHSLLTEIMAFKRVLPNGQITVDLPQQWHTFTDGMDVYNFRGRNWSIGVAIMGDVYFIHVAAVDDPRKFMQFRYPQGLIPTFEILDVKDDEDRFVYLNTVLNHMKTNLILKVLNGNYKNPDSGLTPPPHLVNQGNQ